MLYSNVSGQEDGILRERQGKIDEQTLTHQHLLLLLPFP
jgi:hypothetical protein